LPGLNGGGAAAAVPQFASSIQYQWTKVWWCGRGIQNYNYYLQTFSSYLQTI